MSRLLSAACLGVATAAALAASAAGGEYAPVRKAIPTRAAATPTARVIVKLRGRSSILSASTAGGARLGPQSAAVLGTRLGLALADGRPIGPQTQVLKSTGLTSEALAARVAQDADVEWAVVDHRRYALAASVSDPLYPDSLVGTTPATGQWYLRAPTAVVKSGIDIDTAWAVTHGAGTQVSTPIVIGDVDTGVTSHPDLVNKLLPGYDFVAWSSTDANAIATANDFDGADADPSDPGDWITTTENQSGNFQGCADGGVGGNVSEDSSWHGTQTAGLLGAQTNNALGMAGTAYDTMVVPVRALGKCGGYDSDIIAGARWAAGLPISGTTTNAHPARVVNMSLGASGSCDSSYVDALTDLRNRGVFVIVAAGNDEGLAVGAPANCQPSFSDADQTPIVIAVAGLRHTGTKVGFSDIGPEVTLSAPGGNCVNTSDTAPCLYPILTTVNTGTTLPGAPSYSTAFGAVSLGTSFSTPIVAGTVALMLSANPSLSNAQLISLLRGTVTPFPTASDSAGVPVCQAPSSVAQDECLCTTSTCGAGMLNAGRAVQAAAGATGGVAQLVVPASVAIGADATLDGRGSLPTTGATITDYTWTITDGQAFVSFTGPTTGVAASTTTLRGLASGSVTVKLVVTDSAGHLGVSLRTLRVSPAAPAATIAGLPGMPVGGSVLLSGANTVPAGSGPIASYAWTVTNGSSLVTLSASSGAMVTVTGVAQGTATVQMTATDSAGNTSVVTTPVVVTTNGTTSGSGGFAGGGSGGGATSPAWLAGLLLAGALLAPRRRAARIRRR